MSKSSPGHSFCIKHSTDQACKIVLGSSDENIKSLLGEVTIFAWGWVKNLYGSICTLFSVLRVNL